MDEEFLKNLAKEAESSSMIEQELYDKYNVKRGLRNKDHTGVLVGLTKVGDVIGYSKIGDKITPIDGDLLYSGISINALVKGFQQDKRYGFDETIFLLIFGRLPSKKELDKFSEELANLRTLPHNFTEEMILNFKGRDIMNMLARCVLALYTLDKDADDISTLNVLKQSIHLIARFPTIIAHSYQAMRYHYQNKNLSIRHPEKQLSTAENFLYMLKGNKRFTKLEAEILDLALVLHAEHGGGNNSSFAIHVVSSTGTDTYSAIAAAIGSLKGPLHGGANTGVIEMMEDIKKNVKDWRSTEEVSAYLLKILKKEAGDRSGKIYGFGHAVYTISDPRAIIMRSKARELAKEKGVMQEFELFELIESLVPKIFSKFKKDDKIISANVDFYSGFVYNQLGIPKELNTPLFAMARVAGWCAHRFEEIISAKRIIRPAYKSVAKLEEYVPLANRKG